MGVSALVAEQIGTRNLTNLNGIAGAAREAALADVGLLGSISQGIIQINYITPRPSR